MIKLRTFDDSEKLVAGTCELLKDHFSSAGILMLSGGSTPYAAYHRLTEAPCKVHPDRRLFLSDERMVPPDSPRSNTGNLLPMLRALACEDRFIRVDTALSVGKAARCYARRLEALESIDLGLLGLGADGHTAGIFTPAQARMHSGETAFWTERPDGLQGVSVSPVLFGRIERIVLLVAGESKRSVITTLMDNPEAIPAGIALGGHPSVELWTDVVFS